jgi:hypothetical protein
MQLAFINKKNKGNIKNDNKKNTDTNKEKFKYHKNLCDTNEIDVVITWVNGSDIEWLKKINSINKSKVPEADIRYRETRQLKYALRSVRKFLPWTRRIYLLTDNQIPTWMTKNEKLREQNNLFIVHHNQIFPNTTDLPSFNSMSIESVMHRIRGLSECFFQVQDDFFFYQPMNLSDWVIQNPKESKIIHYIDGDSYFLPHFIVSLLKKIYVRNYITCNHTHQMFLNKYNINENDSNWYYSLHGPSIYKKEWLYEIEKEFNNELIETRKHQIRKNTDTIITRILYNHFLQHFKQESTTFKSKNNKNFFFGELVNDANDLLSQIRNIKENKPCMISMNDELYGSESEWKKSMKVYQDFMEETFPHSENWEI